MVETDVLRSMMRDTFLHVLSECSLERAFERHVSYDRGVLRIGEDLYGLPGYDRVVVISIGKAAQTMAAALTAKLGRERVQGVIVGPTEPTTMLPGFTYFTGGHPLPNAESVRAADHILRRVEPLAAESLLIYLLSGGGSALAEKSCYDDISLHDLVETYRVLVHGGAPIAEINAIRKHLSAIKGGRLAAAAAPARQVSVLVSDVPDHALDSLASGPTMPDSSTVEACYAIVEKHCMMEQFPASVRERFRTRALEETPKDDDPAFQRCRWWTVLSNSTAQRAAAQRAAAERFAVEVDNSCDDWDYARAADYLLGRLRELRQGVSRVALISGGEVTVKVTNGGAGGRNQQFALYCATKIAGENIAVLSAGTDGIDGNSIATGAVADGTTLQRAQAAGLDVDRALREFNAYPLLEKLGDAIVTGPTGNNVRDIRMLLAY